MFIEHQKLNLLKFRFGIDRFEIDKVNLKEKKNELLEFQI